MAYCIQADLASQISDADLLLLADDDGDNAVDAAVLVKVFADVADKIDGYLAGRYSLPLNPVPEVLRPLAVDMAVCQLYARRPNGVPPHRQAQYDAAIRYLEKVAEGRITLGPDDPAGNPPAQNQLELDPDNPPRIFDRAKLKGF